MAFNTQAVMPATLIILYPVTQDGRKSGLRADAEMTAHLFVNMQQVSRTSSSWRLQRRRSSGLGHSDEAGAWDVPYPSGLC